MKITNLVFFSGGICSWAAAKLCARKYGTNGMVLLFADTKMEDEDLYRFIREASENIGLPLVTIADGRTPWEVMRDERLLASTRMDSCSRILKRELMDAWVKENCEADTTLHFGLDWTEQHRLNRLRLRKAPRPVEALTATEEPPLTKPQMLAWLEREGIKPPRLYGLGFPHNNCGGFCVKAGQAQFALLHRVMPERYRQHEESEAELRQHLGWRQTILRDRRGGKTQPLSLADFRKRLEQQQSFDAHEWGGCGCAIDHEESGPNETTK